jgi:protein TonB
MRTPALLSDAHHGKLGYFLALSVLAHLLVVLTTGRPLASPSLQVPAPELVLTTITRRSHPPHPAPLPTENVPALATTALRSLSPDNEPRTASEPELANHLRSLLHTALDQHFVYPDFARRQGWEGRVDVLVRLNGDGRLDAVRVVHSSGYSILDQDALLTLQRIVAIPAARAWLRGYSYDLRFPIVYRLTEG